MKALDKFIDKQRGSMKALDKFIDRVDEVLKQKDEQISFLLTHNKWLAKSYKELKKEKKENG
jgi:hypothetical protein